VARFVVVFDADVLIGYLNREDAHHEVAVERMRAARAARDRRIAAITYSELMVAPLRRGPEAAEAVDAMLADHAVGVVAADRTVAARAAAVRARTGLRLPDAYVVATALAAGADDVRVESFDRRLLAAYAALT
jgi:predicted nucleic acid-binding protein